MNENLLCIDLNENGLMEQFGESACFPDKFRINGVPLCLWKLKPLRQILARNDL